MTWITVHALSWTRYTGLLYRYLLNHRFGGILERSAPCIFVCLCDIPHISYAYSWLAHLIINDAGDIDLAKEDPNGEIHILSLVSCFIQITTGSIPQRRGCRYVIWSSHLSYFVIFNSYNCQSYLVLVFRCVIFLRNNYLWSMQLSEKLTAGQFKLSWTYSQSLGMTTHGSWHSLLDTESWARGYLKT